MRSLRYPLAASCAALLVLAVAGSAQATSVSPRFFGVMANGPLDGPKVDLVKEEGVMRSNGVRSIRVPVIWPDIQPFEKASDVPAPVRGLYPDVDGVPTNFYVTDTRIAAAARNDLEVTALVLQAPRWASAKPGSTFAAPKDPATYAKFLKTLIGRYGPQGSFWAEHPELPKRPLRSFQIWNEPSVKQYFDVRSFAPAYVKLLRASFKAIKKADPGARVVTAGLPNYSWTDLEKLFKAGMKPYGYFDAIAVHPFTGKPSGSVKILEMIRSVLDQHGAGRKPIWVTEISWPSGIGHVKRRAGWVTTRAGQAAKVDQAYRALAAASRRLKLERVFWYSWVTRDRRSPNAFDYAGLRTLRSNGSFADKPALAAYRKVARSLTR